MSTDAPLPVSPDEVVRDGDKKPYEPPVLVRWGTLSEVTMAVGSRGSKDGGTKGPKNTRL